MELAFLLGRILFGGYFVLMSSNHFLKAGMLKGYAQSKGVPAPGVAVFVSGLLIFLGGLGVLLGVFIPLSILFLVIFLFFISLKMHNFWTIQDPMQKMAEKVNFLKNFALLGASLMFLAIPEPWVYGLF